MYFVAFRDNLSHFLSILITIKLRIPFEFAIIQSGLRENIDCLMEIDRGGPVVTLYSQLVLTSNRTVVNA